MLLLCLAMGLSSAMAQVEQTVTGCKATGTASSLGRLEWVITGDPKMDLKFFNTTFTSTSLTGKLNTKFEITNNSGYNVKIDNIQLNGSAKKGAFEASVVNNVATITVTDAKGNSDSNYNVTSIEITYSYTPVTLNLTSAGYATFCAPYDVVIPKDVIASKITGSSKSTDNEGEYSLSLEAVSNNLPAGTPVILSGDALEEPVTYIGVATVTEDKDNAGNYLTGVYTDGVTAPAGSYGLQVQNGTTAFYKASNGFNASKYRAYLTLPASTDAKMLSFGEITIPASVSGVSTEAQVSSIFSASGAKCSSMQKGLNIVKMNDGSVKKVFVK